MKVGISSILFNLEEAIEICKNEKIINHIEVGIDNIEECNILLKYKEIFKQLNISLSIHLPMELNTCESVIYIKNSWIDFINKIYKELKPLDIKYFNMHLGYAMSNRLNNKILISIENTYSNDGDFSNLGNKVSDFEYIFNNSINKNLCFCYDTGHFLINPSNYIEKLSHNTRIIHLSDNNGLYDEHIGIGKGILSKRHIEEILRMNVDYLILEINYEDIKSTLLNLKGL